MSDFFTSIIRTAVPTAVAALLVWLAGKAGYDGPIPDLGPYAVAVVGFGYYTLARLAEEYNIPVLRWLLGKPVLPAPSYPKPEA